MIFSLNLTYNPLAMKKPLFILCAFLFLDTLSAQEGKLITILHTNDLHSRLTGFAPEAAYTPMTVNNDNTRGGFARIASVIKTEKEKTGSVTFAIDAGDFTMGTLFTPLEPEYGFQLPLMKRMGYDVVAFGNNEYDYGLDKLVVIVRSS